MKVKAWFIDREEEKANRYNMYIDIDSRGENNMIVTDENGYYTVRGRILRESEKAVYVDLSTGDIVGSGKGWKTWIPKSLIA